MKGKRDHWFRNQTTICCRETGGEFDVSMWHMEKIINGLCPCCERMVDMKEVKK